MRLAPEFDVVTDDEREAELPRSSRVLPGFTEAESKAVLLTNSFETSAQGLGFGTVTGDFDGQGISFGVQQWNIGKGSLQPLLNEFARRAPDRFQAVFGDGAAELASVLRKSAAAQLAWAKSVSAPGGKSLRAPWQARFRALGSEPVMQQLQLQFIRDRMNTAWKHVRTYGFTTERALALMYDLVVQQGKGWPGVKDRHALVVKRTTEAQARKGAPLTERERLLVIADVVADTSDSVWKEKVRQRKRVIVLGRGLFRRNRDFDVDARFGISDAPLTGGPASSAGTRKPAASAPAGGSGLTGAFRTPVELAQVIAHVAKGVRDENALTNDVFYARDPSRKGMKLRPDQKDLVREWLDIRDRIVRPVLQRAAAASGGAKPSVPAAPGPAPKPSESGVRVAPSRPGGADQVPVMPPPAGVRLSPLALYTGKLRQASKRKAVNAIVVHTTGSGPYTQAAESGRPAILHALETYLNKGSGFAHYVIDYDGLIYATADENGAASHAGWSPIGGSAAFQNWKAPAWWSAVWGPRGARTPVDLLPPGARGPNERSIGIELLGDKHQLYTEQQYRSLAALIADIEARHGFRIPSAPSVHLLGHEDLNPLPYIRNKSNGRADAKGGWDPGAHRAGPRFDWGRVWAYLRQGSALQRSA